MKKFNLIFIIAILFIILTSNNLEAKNKKDVPQWFNEPYILCRDYGDDIIVGVGTSQLKEENAISKAIERALRRVNMQISSEVRSLYEKYHHDSRLGLIDVREFINLIIKNIVDFNNVRHIKEYISKDGTIYVALIVDKKDIRFLKYIYETKTQFPNNGEILNSYYEESGDDIAISSLEIATLRGSEYYNYNAHNNKNKSNSGKNKNIDIPRWYVFNEILIEEYGNDVVVRTGVGDRLDNEEVSLLMATIYAFTEIATEIAVEINSQFESSSEDYRSSTEILTSKIEKVLLSDVNIIRQYISSDGTAYVAAIISREVIDKLKESNNSSDIKKKTREEILEELKLERKEKVNDIYEEFRLNKVIEYLDKELD